MEIAIIGAGMAGLTCGEALAAAGHRVRLFDKGRGPGGRMSTRRADTSVGQCRFDHGAQFIRPRSPAFQGIVDSWVAAGAAAPWTGNFVDVLADGDIRPLDDASRYVGAPSMNAIIRHMASSQAVAWGRRVTGVTGERSGYTLTFEDGTTEGPFDAALIATPVEQARDLLASPAPSFAAEAETVVSDPCWTVMLAFDMALEAPYDAARFAAGPIAWAARNSSKPGRGPEESWVLQAGADWSREHLEADAEAVGEALLEAFSPPDEPVFTSAHRWRFSQVTDPADTPALWDANLGIGACGDWRCGRNVEDAWQSGMALAKSIGAA